MASEFKREVEVTRKKRCDNIWSEIIKRKAGYRSELSGVLGRKVGGLAILTSHHIVGKPNYRLRYELKNGICLINGNEHIFGVHNKYDPVKSKKYQDLIIEKTGKDNYEWLLTLRRDKKSDLKLIEIYLQEELKKLCQ